MSDIVKIKSTTLKAGLAANGTSISLRAFVDSQGNTVSLADLGGADFAVVLKQGSNIEIIKCDGVTQNADGSATLDVATNGRNLLPKSPFTGSSSGLAFSTGAEVIYTNDPYTMSYFVQTDQANTFTGVQTFSQFPVKSGSTTPTDDTHFATKAYVDATATGDAVTSSIKSNVTFGEDVTAGNPVYFKSSDQKWWRAYANDPDTCIGVLLGIAADTAVADATGAVTRFGRETNLTSLTAGSDYYLTDAGALSTSAGTYVVKMGRAIAATVFLVDVEDGDRKHFLDTVTGMIVPFAGTSAPTGFLACDGTLYNFTAYPDLFSLILDTYGLNTGSAFTVTAANDTVDLTAHGFSNGKQLMLTNEGGALPGGLSASTVYYVVEATTNTFKLSLTEGGAAIDITSAGTGTHYYHTQFRVPDLRGSVIIGKGQKTKTFTFVDADVNTSTEVITVPDNDFLHTGQAVALTTSGTLPTGLSATTYYVIRVSSTTIKLATSVANANAGTAVDITAASGGGTHTLTLTLTSRTAGDEGGEELHSLTDAEMPSHTHAQVYTPGPDSTNGIEGGSGTVGNAPQTTGSAGSDTAHNNMPPYVTINFIIKT